MSETVWRHVRASEIKKGMRFEYDGIECKATSDAFRLEDGRTVRIGRSLKLTRATKTIELPAQYLLIVAIENDATEAK